MPNGTGNLRISPKRKLFNYVVLSFVVGEIMPSHPESLTQRWNRVAYPGYNFVFPDQMKKNLIWHVGICKYSDFRRIFPANYAAILGLSTTDEEEEQTIRNLSNIEPETIQAYLALTTNFKNNSQVSGKHNSYQLAKNFHEFVLRCN